MILFIAPPWHIAKRNWERISTKYSKIRSLLLEILCYCDFCIGFYEMDMVNGWINIPRTWRSKQRLQIACQPVNVLNIKYLIVGSLFISRRRQVNKPLAIILFCQDEGLLTNTLLRACTVTLCRKYQR